MAESAPRRIDLNSTNGPGAAVLAAYAVPYTGGALLLFMVQFFFLKYVTDVLLLSPVILGTAFGLAKLIDAVTDPYVGMWSDRTDTPLGRRRPWMFGSALLVAVSFFAIWNPPDLGTTATTVWVCAAIVAFYVCFTAYSIPHFALGAELSSWPHAKTRLYGARQAVETVGMLLAFVAIQVISGADDGRARALAVTALIAVVSGPLLLGTPLLLREHEENRGRGGRGLRTALRDVYRNPLAPRLMLAWWLTFLAVSALGVLGPYAAEYLLGRPDLIAALPGSFVVAGLVAIPFWVWLARVYGKTRMWSWGLLGTCVALGSLALNQSGNVAWFFLSTAAAGVFLGGASVMGPSVLAEVIDYDEQLTGERKEGVYASIFALVGKGGGAFVTMLIGGLLSWIGYVANEVPDDSVRTGLLYTFAGVPAVACVVAAWVLRELHVENPEPRERTRVFRSARHHNSLR